MVPRTEAGRVHGLDDRRRVARPAAARYVVGSPTDRAVEIDHEGDADRDVVILKGVGGSTLKTDANDLHGMIFSNRDRTRCAYRRPRTLWHVPVL